MARPNLLFLYTDEQRCDTLAAYGNDRIEMPHLNALAEEATVFDRAYVTQPVCTPSRASLLTGLWPHANGCLYNNLHLPVGVPCLPEMLTDGEWATAHIGKWHLGDEIYPQHGFATWLGSEDTYHRFYSPRYDECADRSAYHHWLIERGVTPPYPQPVPENPYLYNRVFRPQIHALQEELSRPAFLAEAAGEYITRHADRPWVCYVNFLEPHMPFHSCRDDQYDPADVTLGGNAGHRLGADASLKARVAAAGYAAGGYEGQPLATERDWRELTARYWGMCSLVDTHIGRILQTLRQTGQYDDTIIVFTSDHGDMMGSHGLLAKGYMYEESVRVPLLVRLPGQSSQRHVAGPVSQADIVPTLLDLMGQPRPGHLQGQSLADVARGETPTTGRDVFIEWNTEPGSWDVKPLPAYAADLGTPQQWAASKADPVRTIVTTDGWKFCHSTCGEHQLFDLNADPLELRNLAGDAAHGPRMKDLAGRIRSWQDRTRDIVPLAEA